MAEILPWQRKLRVKPLDKRPDTIFEYKIFSYFEREKEKHITGHVRKYLNQDQIPRWNYFFRPDFRLLNAIDDEKLAELTKACDTETQRLQQLNPSRIINGNLPTGIAISTALSGSLAIGLSFLIPALPWWFLVLIAVVGPLLYLLVYLFAVLFPVTQIRDRIRDLSNQIDAIEKFRREISSQTLGPVSTEREIEAFLQAAFAKLQKDEEHRLEIRRQEAGTYAGPKSEPYGPIVRWALETDRERWLEAVLTPPVRQYRPPIYWVARRGSHYVRYDVQFIFLYYGQLTHYQGVFDLIQGEWMGAARRHIVLANLFFMEDETVEDFEFRRTLRDRIARATIANAREGDPGGATEPEGAEDDGSAEIVADLNQADDDNGLISLTQKTTIRFVGGRESVELNFVASRQRSSLIGQIRARRDEIETANRQNDVQSTESVGEHSVLMAELDELREAERIVSQTTTIDNVDEFVDRILAHTRWTVGQRHFESERGLDEA